MIDKNIASIKAKFGIIGNDPALLRAISVAEQVSATDMTVLIMGESGSGKESFSKIIHSLSKRKHGEFIAINCGAIPEGTIDSELFGHEKGSFTGAVESRKGYFEVTDGGTIFLDEIAEMPLGTQARLLRVLENGEFIKVGSSKVQRTNVRVVAATHVNLLEAIEKGKFREDLYYRLATVPIYVPALRERGTDIELLFRKFTTDFSELHHTRPIQLTEDAKDLLIQQRFPGNIRQLKNLAEQISVLEVGERILDSERLKYYLDFNEPNKSSMVKSSEFKSSEESFSERDILYKVLFDLRKDLTDVKKFMYNFIKSNANDINWDKNQDLEIFSDIVEEGKNGIPNLLPESSKKQEETEWKINTEPNHSLNDVEDFEAEEVENYAEDITLSLDKQEKDLIIRALKKNNNKRKYAAQDLGISERTLYRKIKQYDLEDL